MEPSAFSALFSLPDGYESLQNSRLPIYLYGTGNGACKVEAELRRRGIRIDGVFASDGFVRDRSFLGFPVESLSAVEQREGSIAAVLCFGLEDEAARSALYGLRQRGHAVFAPPLPVYGEGLLDKTALVAERDTAERVFDWLSDEPSREQFFAVLAYHVTGDPFFLLDTPVCDRPPDAYVSHRRLHIDVGAYDGDTVRSYLAQNPHCERILALEPNETSYRRLLSSVDPSRVTCIQAACGEKDGNGFLLGSGRGAHCGTGGVPISVRSLDSICGYPFIHSDGLSVGSIKIDAEGEDAAALAGAGNLITACAPVLCVSAYHRAFDLLSLPLLLKNLRYRSKLFFRRRACVPAWDTMFYLA